MKRQKTYTHAVGEYTFTSTESLARAKEQAADHIAAAYADALDTAPILLQYHGAAALVYRTVDGWTYSPLPGIRDDIRQDSSVIEFNTAHGHAPYTKAVARDKAAYNTAQAGWREPDGTTAPGIITDPAERSRFEKWVTFQLRYKHFETLGYGSRTCWTMAQDESVPLDPIAYSAAVEGILGKVSPDIRQNYKRGIITLSEVKHHAAV